MTYLPSPVRAVPRIPSSRRRRALPTSHRAQWWNWAALLLTGWLVAVVVRIWVAWPVRLPTETPDEIGYLDASRLLSGAAPRFDLSGNTFYRGGYPLLLAPAQWLCGGDPELLYRAVQVENAVVGAMLLPLAWLLARRLGLSRRPALLVAASTAILPVPVLLGTRAMTDAVLPTLVLAWLLCAACWLTAPATGAGRIGWGVAASTLTAFSAVVHARGELILGAQVLLIALAAVRRWRSVRECVIAALAVGATTALGALVNQEVQSRIYPRGITDLAGDLHDRLVSLDGWAWTLRVATGECWYQIAATGGIVAIGIVALLVHARNRGAEGPSRALAAITLGLVLAIAFCTAAALPDDHRLGDTVAMGRYLGGTMTPTVFAIGMVGLLRSESRQVRRLGLAAGAVLAGSAAVVVLGVGERVRTDFFTRSDFPEFAALTSHSHLHLLRITVVAALLLAAVLAAACLSRHATATLAAILAALFVATFAVARAEVLGPDSAGMARLTMTPSSPTLNSPVRVALDYQIPWWIRLPLTYEHPWWSVTVFYGSWQAPPTGVDLILVPWYGREPAAQSWDEPGPVRGRTVVASQLAAPAPGISPAGWVAWQP